MMILDNVNLGELIAKNLFGSKWEKNIDLIVPRKGNFLNPNYNTEKSTYAIYWIQSSSKRVTNFTTDEYNDGSIDTTHYATLKSSVNIQFVGKNAEKWAYSTLFWDERTDVQKNFEDYQSQLCLGDRTITSVPFQQDGYNGEMSYLASFDVIQNVTQEEIIKYWTDLLVLKGSLKVEM